MIYVVGGRGRLGQSIINEYSDVPAISLERSIYENWSNPDSRDGVSRFFDNKATKETVIFVASGLLDPSLSQEDLLRINFFLPRNIIEGASELGIKVVTFGTVMEGLLKSKNSYVRTKSYLGHYVEDVASRNIFAVHLRIHTLYGRGEPSPFMFLGQMLNAIQKNRYFDMTLGKQLREYHHISDEVKAIRRIADRASPGVMDLSHGRPVSLRQVAESVFQSMGKSDLLRVGTLPEPMEENYGTVFKLPEILEGLIFRDTLTGIGEYMKQSCQLSGMVKRN